MLKANSRDDEINKAILEWLMGKNYSSTVDNFLKEAGLKKEDASKGNSLEKKWGTILSLQKKISDLETQNKQLKEDVERGGTSASSGGYIKKENESMGIPKVPAKQTIKGHRGSITAVAFHPIYNLLATGSEDASIIIWECDEFTKDRSVKAHSSTVNSIIFDSVGRYLASCSSDLTVKIWNFDTMTCFKTLNGHEHTVSSIEFTQDGNFLISASRDKSIKLWEVQTGNCKKTFNGHSDWVRSISLNQNGHLLASSSDDETIITWNLEQGSQMYTLTGHENKVECVMFVKNQFAVNNIYTSDYVELFNKSLISGGEGIGKRLSGDLTNNITVGEENAQIVFDLNKKLIEKTKTQTQKINKEYLISCSRDKTIKIWDVFGCSCLFTLNGHDNWVRSIVLHPNGKYFISSSDDKTIRIWELKTGRQVKKIGDAHDRFVTCLAITHKFLLLASGSNDQTIKIWDCK